MTPDMGPAGAGTSSTDAELSADGIPVDLRCSVVLIKGGAVLLLHRAHAPEKPEGDWILPGGHPREGESMRACAVREVKEETGVEVDVGRCLFVYEIVAPQGLARRVELVFAATPSGPVALEPGEQHREPVFVALDQLHSLDLRPPLAGHLRGLVVSRTRGAAYLGNMWRPRRPQ